MSKSRSIVAIVTLSLVLMAGTSFASLTSGLVRLVRDWTPYVITAIAGMPVNTDGDLSHECDACNGTGVVGDGTIELECVVCDGTGKKTTK